MPQITKEYRALKKAKDALQEILDDVTKMRDVNLETKSAIRYWACDPVLRSNIIHKCNSALRELQRCNN